MAFRLRIVESADQKLLENFPNDPYADLLVLTANADLHLSLAYLALDSSYFSELPANTTKVDLSHLPE